MPRTHARSRSKNVLGKKTNGQNGSLTQLVATGAVDDYLTAAPDFTHWARQQRQSTSFVHEAVTMVQESGGHVKCGARITFEQDTPADLVYQAYVRIQLPALGVETQHEAHDMRGFGDFPILKDYRVRDDGEGLDEVNKLASHTGRPKAVWTNGIGYAMIRRATWRCCGQDLDTVTGKYLYCWDEISTGDSRRLKRLIGRFDTVDEQVAFAEKDRVIYAPLDFDWCCNGPKDHDRAFPCVKIQYAKLKIDIELEDLCYLAAVALPSDWPDANAYDEKAKAFEAAIGMEDSECVPCEDVMVTQRNTGGNTDPATNAPGNDQTVSPDGMMVVDTDLCMLTDITVSSKKPNIGKPNCEPAAVEGVPLCIFDKGKCNKRQALAWEVNRRDYFRIVVVDDCQRGPGVPLTRDFPSVDIELESVYLDSEERELLSDPVSVLGGSEEDHCCEHVCIFHSDVCEYVKNDSSTSDIRLTFNHPSIELIATVQPSAYRQIGQFLKYSPADPNAEFITAMRLRLNGKLRFEDGPCYFRQQQLHLHHSHIPDREHIYVYSFGKTPEHEGWDSTLNFSRIDNAEIELDFDREGTEPRIVLINDDEEEDQDELEINIYDRLLNVLRYEGGLVGLIFSN